MPNVLKSKIEKKLSDLSQISNSITVLKGIPLEAVYPEYAGSVDLDALSANKLGYLMKLMDICYSLTTHSTHSHCGGCCFLCG